MYQLINDKLPFKKHRAPKGQIDEARQHALSNNSIHYNGNPCKNGHDGLRYSLNGRCTKCSGYKSNGKKRGGKINVIKQLAITNNEKFFIPEKPCKRCNTSKRFTLSSLCVQCSKMIKRKPERERQYTLAKFGLSEVDYNNMLIVQNNLCAICNGPEQRIDPNTKTFKRLSIDHCHLTGKVRGLLCSQCNIGIGNLKHNPEILRKAALYCAG